MNRNVFREFVILSCPFFFLAVLVRPAFCQEQSLEEILDKMFSLQTKKYEEIKTLVYQGNSVYRELTDEGKVKKTTLSERIIYLKGRDRQTEGYRWMSIDGRALDQTEMMAEVVSWQKRGRRTASPKLPFYPEMRDAYTYELIGSEAIGEQETWKIGFAPVKPAQEYPVGTMYVSKSDHDIVRMESKPSKTSNVVKKLDMVMTFAKEQGYWLLKKFEMQAKIKVKFLITFAKVNFTLEDYYSDFKLNMEIPDSLFKDVK